MPNLCPGCACPSGSGTNWYSVPQLGQLWLDSGGDVAAVVAMTAVACCEAGNGIEIARQPSGLRAAALAQNGGADMNAASPDCALGGWQILNCHACDQGISPYQLFVPSVNAQFAVSLSFNGANVAAWDTAWTWDESGSRPSSLSQPLADSPAGALMAAVETVLGAAGVLQSTGGGGGFGQPAIGGSGPGAGHQPGDPTQIYSVPIPPVPAGGPFPGFTEVPIPNQGASGWDNVRQWLNADQVALHELDVLCMNTLAEALHTSQRYG